MRFRKEARKARRPRFNKTRKVAKTAALVGVGLLAYNLKQANDEIARLNGS